MDHTLILVRLSAEQVIKAKSANGIRKRITHALLCGPYGQLFGTERFCQKYFNAWRPERGIFPNLFQHSIEVDHYKISDFVSTFNLVEKLIDADKKFDFEQVP